MQKRKIHLVRQHLENASRKILENYPDLIREYIRGKQGIYALYKNNRLYYVGLASNLRGRLKNHLSNKHKGKWDRFSIYLIDDSDRLRELEAMVLRIADPKGNAIKGKLIKSEDLKTRIHKDIRTELNGIFKEKEQINESIKPENIK